MSFIFIFHLFVYSSVCMPVCLCTACMWRPEGARRWIYSPWIGVTGGWEARVGSGSGLNSSGRAADAPEPSLQVTLPSHPPLLSTPRCSAHHPLLGLCVSGSEFPTIGFHFVPSYIFISVLRLPFPHAKEFRIWLNCDHNHSWEHLSRDRLQSLSMATLTSHFF